MFTGYFDLGFLVYELTCMSDSNFFLKF